MKVFEYDMQGTPLNTANGHKVKCKIVATNREKAFLTFASLFPTARPAQILEEMEVTAA